MVSNITKKFHEYAARAEDARARAQATTDLVERTALLTKARHWQRLVESYKVLEVADLCLTNCPGQRGLKQTSPSGVLVVPCPITGREYSTGILVEADRAAWRTRSLTNSHCPYCDIEHAWCASDVKIVGIRPSDRASVTGNSARLSETLGLLVDAAIDRSDGKTRAAFYTANDKGTALHHVAGMTPAYAACVDGFAIGTKSLACGLAAATRRPVITPDVMTDPSWSKWRWLANAFDYRGCWSFPIAARTGIILGTFAIYHPEPAEPNDRDLDLVSFLTSTAATLIARRPDS
jgi:hypothetical protein